MPSTRPTTMKGEPDAGGPGTSGLVRASMLRRVAALTVDWVACSLVSRLLFPGVPWGTPASGALVLAVFFGEVTLFTWLIGASFGQRIVGIEVAGLSNRQLQRLEAAAIRTALICLVIPAVVADSDGRGLHDRVTGTRVVRSLRATAR